MPVAKDEKNKHPSGAFKKGEAPTLDSEVDELDDNLVSFRYGENDVIAERYRLGKRLGEGGMGEVWLAHNETLDIDVAIKLIRADTQRTDHAERLLREARAAAKLVDPAIVRIFDFGTTERGDPFVVMELLEGHDLATALENRGRMSATKTVRTLLPIINGLAAAHAKGIVHRDLKPENIFLQRQEDGPLQPKLVDFGIAKLERSKALRLTQTGALLGSPLYMSPEQARGDEVDHRADIWSLCVVLYEAITGRPPFEGKNYNAILYSIIANEPPDMTQLSVGDEALWSIVKKGLEKDPDHRWQSARELGLALARWLQGRGMHQDITGASVDSVWIQRGSLHDGERSAAILESVPPGPLPTNRALEGATTQRQLSRPPRRALFVVGAAVALGVVGGILLFALASEPEPSRPVEATESTVRAEPVSEELPSPARGASTVAPVPSSAGSVKAGARLSEPPIPVEALEKAPPEEEAEPEPTVKPKPRPKRVWRRKTTTTEPKRKPAGKLKDPFQ